jgi:hypothetical protein
MFFDFSSIIYEHNFFFIACNISQAFLEELHLQVSSVVSSIFEFMIFCIILPNTQLSLFDLITLNVGITLTDDEGNVEVIIDQV